MVSDHSGQIYNIWKNCTTRTKLLFKLFYHFITSIWARYLCFVGCFCCIFLQTLKFLNLFRDQQFNFNFLSFVTQSTFCINIYLGLKSYALFQNWTSAQRQFDLKSQVWFQTKIGRHGVQLPLYYIHFKSYGLLSILIFIYPLQKTQLKKKNGTGDAVT